MDRRARESVASPASCPEASTAASQVFSVSVTSRRSSHRGSGWEPEDRPIEQGRPYEHAWPRSRGQLKGLYSQATLQLSRAWRLVARGTAGVDNRCRRKDEENPRDSAQIG